MLIKCHDRFYQLLVKWSQSIAEGRKRLEITFQVRITQFWKIWGLPDHPGANTWPFRNFDPNCTFFLKKEVPSEVETSFFNQVLVKFNCLSRGITFVPIVQVHLSLCSKIEAHMGCFLQKIDFRGVASLLMIRFGLF